MKKAKLMQTKTQNRRNHGKFDRSHFWLELFLWVLLLCNPCVNLPKSWFKRGSWETLNPKVCIEVFDFFFSSYFVNVSSEFNQVIFWSRFMQYEWDIWYLLIVTLSADVLVLVLGVVMETVNKYLIVNICCHRISYWHIWDHICVCNMFLVCFLKGRTLFAFWKINKWYVAKDKVFVQSALKSFNIELAEIQSLLHPTIIIIDRSTFSLVGSGKY